MSFVRNLFGESVTGTRYVIAMLISVPFILVIMSVLAWSQRSWALAAGVAAAGLGWLVLGERLETRHFAGLALILVGLALMERQRLARR